MLLKVLELFVIFLTLWFIVSQLLIPASFGERFFPLFRRKVKLEEKLIEVQGKEEEAKLEKELNKRSNKL